MKKILIILIPIVIIVLAILIFYFYKNSDTTIQDQDGNSSFPTSGDASDSDEKDTSLDDNQNVVIGGNLNDLNAMVGFTDTGGEIYKITDSKVVSAYAWGEGGLKTAKVSYVEAGTGHIYEYDVASKIIERVSNKTIPKVKEAIWADENNLVIRYLEGEQNTLKTYLGKLVEVTKFDPVNGTTTEKVFEGKFLSDNIKELAVSPNGKEIYYLLGNSGFKQGLNDEKPLQVFTSKIKSWNISWPIENKLVLTIKPSDGVAGYSYSINPKVVQTDSDLIRIAGPALGLTLNHGRQSGEFIFSTASFGSIQSLYEHAGTRSILGFATLVEKCVFGRKTPSLVYCAVPDNQSNAKYPDDWYKGRIFFKDSIYSANLKNGDVSLVLISNVSLNETVDAINLGLNEDDTNLIFIDKRTQNLWMIDLVTEERII